MSEVSPELGGLAPVGHDLTDMLVGTVDRSPDSFWGFRESVSRPDLTLRSPVFFSLGDAECECVHSYLARAPR